MRQSIEFQLERCEFSESQSTGNIRSNDDVLQILQNVLTKTTKFTANKQYLAHAPQPFASPLIPIFVCRKKNKEK